MAKDLLDALSDSFSQIHSLIILSSDLLVFSFFLFLFSSPLLAWQLAAMLNWHDAGFQQCHSPSLAGIEFLGDGAPSRFSSG